MYLIRVLFPSSQALNNTVLPSFNFIFIFAPWSTNYLINVLFSFLRAIINGVSP